MSTTMINATSPAICEDAIERRNARQRALRELGPAFAADRRPDRLRLAGYFADPTLAEIASTFGAGYAQLLHPVLAQPDVAELATRVPPADPELHVTFRLGRCTAGAGWDIDEPAVDGDLLTA
ncbi:hypothetical protein Q5424_01285 [Conexibacter sp. JD483]|uniref:hypothetical protein n=1 Tax=unclassified Conexibacter TaxID=2627773 RepID=UPI002728B170|nr:MULTISPECIES: hypothetical protein [unclassified Conexibacter]MDO8185862.1 hypothetical protein [Conexibacter sp. CPCC 205706]MDO8198606.1 hypothetical protein [Conexibacter sp. CPCC 205762]MDR9367692.1 hypothetical protein [Conexibacter sp. JD483]